MANAASRKNQRPMMLYISAEIYAKIKREAEAKSPPIKPGPMAAEILRLYFLKENPNVS